MKTRLFILLSCFIFAIFSLGMTFAPTSQQFSYNGLKLGDDYNKMIERFGTPRYDQSDYAWGNKLTYYIYKNENKIGINADTGKVVDIVIVDDTYNNGDTLKDGTTSYKIEDLFGKTQRQFINGQVCYAYKNGDERILLQVEPTDRYLESFRITSLPIELPEDTTAYLPDEATDESENPLFGDKEIDTSAVTGDKVKNGGFKINYRYSVTK